MRTNTPHWAAVAVLFSTLVLTVRATPILPGETKTNTIVFAGQMDSYEFGADAGDTVTILLAASGNRFSPRVGLLGPGGLDVSAWTGGASATIQTQRVARAGTYLITCRADNGTGTGDYAVSFIKNPGSNLGDPEGGLIKSGETKIGRIALGDLDAFSFKANTGSVVTILMAVSGNSFSPRVELHAQDGSMVKSAWTGGASATIQAQRLEQAGTYLIVCRADNGTGTGDYGVSLACVDCPPEDEGPVITGQPQSQIVNQGTTVNFSVTASGAEPLSYRWRFNGTDLSNDGQISGSTTTNVTISNVQSGNAGGYIVVVTNTYGTATSIVATLTVRVPPSISTQPVSQTVSTGDQVTFGVGASGTPPLDFQWQLNGTNIPGATGPTYTISNAQAPQTGYYTVVVSNAADSLTSTAASLSILDLKMYAGLTIIGPIGTAYRVDYSTNLAEPTPWMVLTNITLSSSPYRFVDWDSAGVRQRPPAKPEA